jgi:hypothetical protein
VDVEEVRIDMEVADADVEEGSKEVVDVDAE